MNCSESGKKIKALKEWRGFKVRIKQPLHCNKLKKRLDVKDKSFDAHPKIKEYPGESK